MASVIELGVLHACGLMPSIVPSASFWQASTARSLYAWMITSRVEVRNRYS